MKWRNRIVTMGTKPAHEFKTNPANWRTHPRAQRDALKGVLGSVGWVTGVIVNADGTLIDGHARVEEALKLGDDTLVPFVQVDLSEDEERTILATLDPLSAMAEANKPQLDALLRQVQSPDAGVQQMLSELADSAGAVPDEETKRDPYDTIRHRETGYLFGDVDPLKLAYRVEAAWRSAGNLAIDLYSGEGQLARWYARRFDRLIRVDRIWREGIDNVMPANRYLAGPFKKIVNDFDYIDFDDEGSPLREVVQLFGLLKERTRPFVFALTDGSGLTLKLQGKFSPALYRLEGGVRQATEDDYHNFDALVTDCVQNIAVEAGWVADLWSSTRKPNGNVIYQTYGVSRPNA